MSPPPESSSQLDTQQPSNENAGTDKGGVSAAEPSAASDTVKASDILAEAFGMTKNAGETDTRLQSHAGEEQATSFNKDEAEDLRDETANGEPVETAQVNERIEAVEQSAPPTEDASVDNITSKTEGISLSSSPPTDPTPKSLGKAPVRSSSPPPPPPKDNRYLASDQEGTSRAQSPLSQGYKSSGRNSEDAEATEYAEKYGEGDGAADDSRSEIQSIMEQFDHDAEGEGPGAEEIMSPRMELANNMLDPPISHPPRRSSLEPMNKPLPSPIQADSADVEQPLYSPPPRRSSLYPIPSSASVEEKGPASGPCSPNPHAPMYKPTPPVPQPDPEPDLPFDFHRFLEQLRHRTADPVAKFLRSFLFEFGKKQWMVHEQVKIIADFLEFISKKMAQCEVWRTVSDAEFDNAREGMEKLVMNRLYSQTFSPAIPPPDPVAHKNRRRHDPPGPGRKGQHQEDVERDEVLAQKVRIYKWIKEEHLDIKPVGDKGKKFLLLAQQELLKIKSYRAPRDKVICILNCCKVIFGFLRTSQSDMSADAFVPLLIYTVLQANPDHLVSNVQYILRFRNQDKLGGEAGYYISSLMGAIQFIENLDRTSLTITDAEFEANVEAAVSAIAERHSARSSAPSPLTPTFSDTATPSSSRLQPSSAASTNPHHRLPSPHLHLSEKSSLSRAEVTPRNSLEAESAGPRRSTSVKKSSPDQKEEEDNAVVGLLRTIQRPLSTIGRIFSDTDTSSSTAGPAPTPPTPQLPPRRSSDYPGGQKSQQQSYSEKPRRSGDGDREQRERQRLSAEDAAARQASAEAEQARRIQLKEHRVVVETLAGMFPGLDREVIDDVVRVKEGRVGLAVDACLALSNP